jgi:hypothetical protein
MSCRAWNNIAVTHKNVKWDPLPYIFCLCPKPLWWLICITETCCSVQKNIIVLDMYVAFVRLISTLLRNTQLSGVNQELNLVEKKNVSLSLSLSLSIYIYIYIERERERERAVLRRLATPSDFHIPLPSNVPFAHSQTYSTHGYIYIYIYPIFPGSSGTTSYFSSLQVSSLS